MARKRAFKKPSEAEAELELLASAEELATIEGLRAGELPPALGIAGSGGSLLQRVRRLVGTEKPARLLVLVSALVGGLFWTVAGAADEDDDEGEVLKTLAVEEEPSTEMVQVIVLDAETLKPIGDAELGFVDPTFKLATATTQADGRASVPVDAITGGSLHLRSTQYLRKKPARLKDAGAGKPDGFTRLPGPHIVLAFVGDRISGRVVDAQGAPVEGAKITVGARLTDPKLAKYLGVDLSNSGPDSMSNWEAKASSDQDGRYELTLPKKAAVAWTRTTCLAEGFASFQAEGRVSPTVLSRGIVVRGRVLDAEGKPLARMQAGFDWEGRVGILPKLGISDTDGFLDEVRIEPGSYEVGIRSPGSTAKSSAELPLPFMRQELVVPDLEEGGRFEFTMKPLPHRLVQFEWGDIPQIHEHFSIGWIAGTVDGSMWSGGLYDCIEDGRVCALVPSAIESPQLGLDSNGFLAYRFIPAGWEAAVGLIPIQLRDDAEPLGAIAGERPASLAVDMIGLLGETLDERHFTATADGRFGKRKLRALPATEVVRCYGIYPGESVEFSIDHPKFKKVDGREEKLEESETRYVNLVMEPKR